MPGRGSQPIIDDNRCNAIVVPDNEGTVVLETVDETVVPPATMGRLTFPQTSVPQGGLVVALDCRQGGFPPSEGPLPTDLRQWPLFCHIEATNPDGSPFTGTLPGFAALDLCVVDDLIVGQEDYHGFGSHEDLVLGKSNGPGDFTFLPPAASALSCEGNTTILAMGRGARFFDALESGLVTAFGLFMPEELHAAPMRFRRDGGVGGLLGSFSDINPVEPAYIEGQVYVVESGVEGVTVTLGGDAAGVTTTDADGFYRFGPLQAAEGGGSSYTVTVSDLPEGVAFAEASQDVEVTGSGTFEANFQGVNAIYNPDNDHWYLPVTVPATIQWSAAKLAASEWTLGSCSGYLATITSADETAFALENLYQAADDGYLLGGQLIGGVWTWITGEPWSYTNWHAGEPSGDGTVLQFFGRWGTPIEEWNDTIDPFPHFGYVVEFDASCS